MADEEQAKHKNPQEEQQNLKEGQQHAELLIDVDDIKEYFLEYILSNSVPSSSSIKTRRMVREEAERAE